MDYAIKQLSDPDAFVKKVRALYASVDVDVDTLAFKDGRIIERYSAPLLIQGSLVGRVWSFRDITDRKRAEETLQEAHD